MDYWHRQVNKPSFPDLIWSKPENKNQAGKLLIIGGNAHEFTAPAEAYNYAVKAGIGTAKVLLPDALRKIVGNVLENGEFAPSTSSGSFSKKALAEWTAWNDWADGVILAGDLGRNSETAVVVERFIEMTARQLTITKDAVDYLYTSPKQAFSRENTTLVISLAQLQKLCIGLGWHKPVKFSMTILQLVEFLHELTTTYPCNIIVRHNEVIFVAVRGNISTTKVTGKEIWRVDTAAQASVWWLQNPAKTFEALTVAVYGLVNNTEAR